MKISNETLIEAQNLEAIIKASQTKLDAIKDALKEKGSFATKEFVVAVSEQSRENLAGLKCFEDAGYKKSDLEKEGLINHITFKTVKIERKVA